jgi:tRNA/tmRNA/rRNA uracil-C5-methylase (TrmA/RlmC/RlmD family)
LSLSLSLIRTPWQGLDRALVDALLRGGGVRRLVYVSCGWQALQRDTADLVAAGLWRVTHAGAPSPRP